jgi:hypothetical protein
MNQNKSNPFITSNSYLTLLDSESFDPRTLKRHELIKICYEYGLKISKKTKNKVFVEFLIKIHRKFILQKNIHKKLEHCPICLDTLECINTIITKCGHAFCKKCIFSYITLEKEMCPFCRETYTYEHIVKDLDEKEVHDLLNSMTVNKINESFHPIAHPLVHRLLFNLFIFKKIITYIVKYYFLYKSVEFLYLLLLQKEPNYTIADYMIYPIDYDSNFTYYKPIM